MAPLTKVLSKMSEYQEVIQIIALTMGVAWASGLNLYAAVAALGACRCTEAPNVLSAGEHVVGNFWIYLGRLLYPVGLEFPGRVGSAHLVAGIVVGIWFYTDGVIGDVILRKIAAMP